MSFVLVFCGGTVLLVGQETSLDDFKLSSPCWFCNFLLKLAKCLINVDSPFLLNGSILQTGKSLRL